jgi:hypothetical protein
MAVAHLAARWAFRVLVARRPSVGAEDVADLNAALELAAKDLLGTGMSHSS